MCLEKTASAFSGQFLYVSAPCFRTEGRTDRLALTSTTGGAAGGAIAAGYCSAMRKEMNTGNQPRKVQAGTVNASKRTRGGRLNPDKGKA